MKQKRAKWIFIVFFAIGLTGIRAQSSLNIKVKTGAQSSFFLSDIKTLTFTSGTMSINKRDGNRNDFALANVSNLNFAGITYIDEIPTDDNIAMMLYPNPVRNFLQVKYESKAEENGYVQIFNISGKVVYQQLIKSQTGTNYIDIYTESFQNGIYMCRVQNGNNTETAKFIKY
jgi:hypothetical protein